MLKRSAPNILPQDGQVILFPQFLPNNLAIELFNELLNKADWHTEYIRLFGKTVPCPRLICYYGDAHLNYYYSGNAHITHGWPDYLTAIKTQIETHLNTSFNFVLGNLYRDGNDYMGWHDDGEPALGPTPLIAALSLGAERIFEFKHKNLALTKKILLPIGSLLVMSSVTQRYWQHRLPKAKTCSEQRINLTFRQLL